MKAADRIIQVLHEASRPLAIHEMVLPGVSQTAASARLRELAKVGIVVGERVPNKAYKAWTVASRGAVSRQMLDAALSPEPIYHPERW